MSTKAVVIDTTVLGSPFLMPSNNMPPMPLILKIPSVTIAPPMRAPRSDPRNVTTGIRELRRMWRVITEPLLKPLARAVRTKSALVVSEMDCRVNRMT